MAASATSGSASAACEGWRPRYPLFDPGLPATIPAGIKNEIKALTHERKYQLRIARISQIIEEFCLSAHSPVGLARDLLELGGLLREIREIRGKNSRYIRFNFPI
jgi:hypothetical protein